MRGSRRHGPVYADSVTDPVKSPGRFRSALSRLTADRRQIEDESLQGELEQAGATSVAHCTLGQPVCVAGTVKAVTLRPVAGVPTLEAEMYDGSGTVHLIWLGRRRIRGIQAGRSMVARGRMTRHNGRPTIYNPAYELRPGA